MQQGCPRRIARHWQASGIRRRHQPPLCAAAPPAHVPPYFSTSPRFSPPAEGAHHPWIPLPRPMLASVTQGAHCLGFHDTRAHRLANPRGTASLVAQSRAASAETVLRGHALRKMASGAGARQQASPFRRGGGRGACVTLASGRLRRLRAVRGRSTTTNADNRRCLSRRSQR